MDWGAVLQTPLRSNLTKCTVQLTKTLLRELWRSPMITSLLLYSPRCRYHRPRRLWCVLFEQGEAMMACNHFTLGEGMHWVGSDRRRTVKTSRVLVGSLS